MITYTKIGKVIHYYDKIEVAIILLEDELKVGQHIKFTRGGEDLFSQEVFSIELEHNSIDQAKPGDEVGIKVSDKVREGSEVFREE